MDKVEKLLKDVQKISSETEEEVIKFTDLESCYSIIDSKVRQAAKEGKRSISINISSDQKSFDEISMMFKYFSNYFLFNKKNNCYILSLSW
jgi:hypothetical protein